MADGFSMAISNYLSVKSETEYHRHHKDYRIFARRGRHPIKAAFATFYSFFAVGLIPLVSFLLAIFIPYFEVHKISFSILFTAVALASVGAIKGTIVKKHPLNSAVETLAIGGVAAALAFAVGFLLKGLA